MQIGAFVFRTPITCYTCYPCEWRHDYIIRAEILHGETACIATNSLSRRKKWAMTECSAPRLEACYAMLSQQHSVLQATFCELCSCWVPGGAYLRQQHVNGRKHRKLQSTSHYRSEHLSFKLCLQSCCQHAFMHESAIIEHCCDTLVPSPASIYASADPNAKASLDCNMLCNILQELGAGSHALTCWKLTGGPTHLSACALSSGSECVCSDYKRCKGGCSSDA